MSLTTFSLFYFGHTVTSDNNQIDFKEGAGSELTAVLNIGDYTLTEYVVEVARAFNEAGSLTYTVSVSRSTRKITVSAGSPISLLVSTGSHISSSAYGMIGFSGSDRTGASSYLGDSASGSSYTPQFILQDHKDSEQTQQAVDATVLKSASGKVQVVRFGTQKFIQARIRFSNNKVQPTNSPIRQDLSGVAHLEQFLQYIVTKAKFEYMPDENDVNEFQSVLLESNEESRDGTGYDLRERYDLGLPGYFETSIFKLRVIE